MIGADSRTKCRRPGATQGHLDKEYVVGISAKLLGENERLVLSMRTHWKIAIGPVLLLLVLVAAAVIIVALVPAGQYQQWIRIGVITLAAVVALAYAVWPLLNWLASTYAVTDRRLITRHGVITRTGRDIPLTRVNDVSSERGLLDRILGCGTLVIWSAGEQGRVVLPDVPHVERVQRTISELVYARETDDDETPERR
jgi:membrane protein YdbS with pleckstrin-like domain